MSYSEWIRRYRRTLGIPLVLAALLLAHFDVTYALLSAFLVVAGETIRIWSAGHLRKEEVLTTGGPYRVIRNPLYMGSFLIAAGFCLIAGSPWIWGLTVTYFLLCYLPVIRFEEKIMREKFPNHYPRYAAEIHALIPTVKIFPTSSTRFSWKQVFRNKEYNAVLGIILAYVYLIFLRQ